MIQRRLGVLKWLTTTPAVGVCTLCSREFKVPMSALMRTADAQASLQEQFDRPLLEQVFPGQPQMAYFELAATQSDSHECEPEASRGTVRDTADVLLREEPEEDEEEDDRKQEDDEDDDETDDGYSE